MADGLRLVDVSLELQKTPFAFKRIRNDCGVDGGDGDDDSESGDSDNDDDGMATDRSSALVVIGLPLSTHIPLKPSFSIRNHATLTLLHRLGLFLAYVSWAIAGVSDARAQLYQVVNTCELDSDSMRAYGRLRLLAYPPCQTTTCREPARMQRHQHCSISVP